MTYARNSADYRLVTSGMTKLEEAKYRVHLAIGDVDQRLPLYKAIYQAEVAPGIEPHLALIEYTAALVSEGIIAFKDEGLIL
jgi:hypothetical protein